MKVYICMRFKAISV